LKREKQIKGWIRAKKNKLIAMSNPQWNDLAVDWYSPVAGDPSLRSG